MSMTPISGLPSLSSTAQKAPFCQPDSGTFSQMELPLHRERDERRGSFYRNCRFVDAVRRSIVKRLPHGAAPMMAASLNQFDELPRVLARIHDEISGQTRLSLDVFVTSLLHLSAEDARHVLGKLARPIGLYVAPLPCCAAEDSAS